MKTYKANRSQISTVVAHASPENSLKLQFWQCNIRIFGNVVATGITASVTLLAQRSDSFTVYYCSLPNFWKSVLHLQKQRPKKKRVMIPRRWQLVRSNWVCEKSHQREDVKSQGVRENQETSGKKYKSGKKKRKEAGYPTAPRMARCILKILHRSDTLEIIVRNKSVWHMLWETQMGGYS